MESPLYTASVLPEIGFDPFPAWNAILALRHLDERGQWAFFPREYEQIEKSVRAFLAPHGFTRFKTGAFRIALFHREKPWLLKVPFGEFAGRISDEEMEALRSCPPSDLHRFPETYDLGERILLQRRYLVDRSRYTEWEKQILAEAARLDVHDVKAFNVGWRESGGFLFIDFHR